MTTRRSLLVVAVSAVLGASPVNGQHLPEPTSAVSPAAAMASAADEEDAPQVIEMASGLLDIFLSVFGGVNYLEVSRRNINLGNDFSSPAALTSQDATYHLPSVRESGATALALGYMSPAGGFTATYMWSRPTAETALGSREARFTVYSGELVILTNQSASVISPLLRLGFSFNSLDVPESADRQAVVSTTAYDDWGWILGGGGLLRLGAIFLSVDYSRQWITFDQLQGAGLVVDVEPELSATNNVLTLRAGIWLGWRG